MTKNEYYEQLNKNNVLSIIPSGNSMWPILKNKGQSVLIEKKTERLKVFDVALYYRDDGTTVLHRIVKVLENGYIIVGDSQTYQETVLEEKVFGKMIGYYRKDKFISVEDEKYKNKVYKWYKNEKKRRRKCKFHFFKLSIFYKIKKLVKIVLFLDKKGK